MSAIFEPASATWSVGSQWPTVTATANAEDHNVTLRRRYYSSDTPDELIELHLSDLPGIEAALLNARLWLERAVKQHAELRAAEETGRGDDEPIGLPCSE